MEFLDRLFNPRPQYEPSTEDEIERLTGCFHSLRVGHPGKHYIAARHGLIVGLGTQPGNTSEPAFFLISHELREIAPPEDALQARRAAAGGN